MSSPLLPVELVEYILSFVCGSVPRSTPYEDSSVALRRETTRLARVSHTFADLLDPFLYRVIAITKASEWSDLFDPTRGALVAGPRAQQRRSFVVELIIRDGLAADPPPSLVLPRRVALPNLRRVCLIHDRSSSEPDPIRWDPSQSSFAQELERPRIRVYRALLADAHNVDTVSLSISKSFSADLYRDRIRPFVPAQAMIALYMDPAVSSHDTVRSLLVVHRAKPGQVRLVGFGSELRRQIERAVGSRSKEWADVDGGFVGWAWEDEHGVGSFLGNSQGRGLHRMSDFDSWSSHQDFSCLACCQSRVFTSPKRLSV